MASPGLWAAGWGLLSPRRPLLPAALPLAPQLPQHHWNSGPRTKDHCPAQPQPVHIRGLPAHPPPHCLLPASPMSCSQGHWAFSSWSYPASQPWETLPSEADLLPAELAHCQSPLGRWSSLHALTVLHTHSASSDKVGAQASCWVCPAGQPLTPESSREPAQVSWMCPSKAAPVVQASCPLPDPPCHDGAMRVQGAGACSPHPSRACCNDLPPSLTRSHIWFQLVGR